MDLDLRSAGFVADPYPVYEQVRAGGRCVRSERAGAWLVTGYDDAVTILRDPARFSSSIMAGDEFGPWYDGAATMLGTDPPEHTRLRSVVQRLFTARATAARAARVDAIVADLLAAEKVAGYLSAGDPVELVGTVLAPLPVLVLLDLLGLPAVDLDSVLRWTADMALGSIAALDEGTDPDAAAERQGAVAAGTELAAYVREHIAGGRTGAASVLSELVAAAGTGRVSPPEVVATGVLLLLAGIETSIKALGNLVALVGSHQDQQRRILADPDLVGPAVEEVLRFGGPTQFDPRVVRAGARLGGTQLQPGDIVWILTPAANRDPARFPRARSFDVARTPNPHLGFGQGVHLCLGAPLARLESRVLLTRLLRLAPHFGVRDVDHGRGFFVRGPVRLVLVPRVG